MFHASHRQIAPRAALVVAFALAFAACGDDATPPPPVDAGTVDAPADASQLDLGAADLGGCEDADGDGSPATSCGGDDCDDADPARYPGATEVCDAAGVDEDCDPTTLGPDGDGDGSPATSCCNGPTACGTDCDDARATVNVTAIESCNRVDDDCDGEVDDGLGSTRELCNMADDDCDGAVDEDVCVPCAPGFSGFDGACTDVDECATPTACHPARRCVNAMGSYACEPCAAGYLDDGATGCVDINECVEGRDRCVSLRACANTAGSYTCGPCPTGYVDDGSYDCTDVDECATGAVVCDPLAMCVNVPGTARCDCPPRYALAADGRDCLDDDARLSGLVASTGSLSPAFDPDVDAFTVVLPAPETTITLTPRVAAPARTTIEVDGMTVASDAPSAAISIPPLGTRIVPIVVTAESGATRTVQVAVSRVDPTCPEAEPLVLDCTSGTVAGTTVGGVPGANRYCPTQTINASYVGPKRFYTFVHRGAGPVDVRLETTATNDHDVFVTEATSSCTSGEEPCAGLGTSGNTEDVRFTATPGSAFHVVYGPFGTTAPAPFTITVTCTPVVCGDSARSGAEECDDGNAVSGDGCSADCRVEPGFACERADADFNGIADLLEVCFPRTGPASCAAATPVTVDARFPVGGFGTGGSSVFGPGCGFLSARVGTYATFFTVTIPVGRRVLAFLEDSPGVFDDASSVDVLASCGATGCLDTRNRGSGDRRVVIDNPSSTPLTRILAVANPHGPREITFSFHAREGCGDREVDPGEGCDDGNTNDGDGCSATCNREPSAVWTSIVADCVDTSAGNPVRSGPTESDPEVRFENNAYRRDIPFPLDFLGTAVDGWIADADGFLTLVPTTSTRTGATFIGVNAPIPTATAPNGFVAAFWDARMFLGSAGAMTWLIEGAPGARRLVVGWNRMSISSTDAEVSFQVHLHEADQSVSLHYCAATGTSPERDGRGATIGLEGHSGVFGVPVSFNTPGAAPVGGGYRYVP